MMFHYPWHRENRSTVTQYDGVMYLQPSQPISAAVNSDDPHRSIPKFEVTASVPVFYKLGGLTCLGGGGIGSFRLTDVQWWTIEVSGCTLGNSLPSQWSGDSLTFTVGPQWIFRPSSRWSPHVHFRIGGQKITEEYLNANLQKQVLSMLPENVNKSKYRDLYTKHWETTGLTVALGGGLDVTLNRAIALRVAEVDYSRSWLDELNGRNFNHGLRVGAGVVLKLGTW